MVSCGKWKNLGTLESLAFPKNRIKSGSAELADVVATSHGDCLRLN